MSSACLSYSIFMIPMNSSGRYKCDYLFIYRRLALMGCLFEVLPNKCLFSDVDSNHKSVKLSIVEEGEHSGENSDTQSQTQSQNHLPVPEFHEPRLSSNNSSAENLAANTRHNQHSPYNHSISSNRLNASDHESSNTNARRPSILLEMQEMISGRRPSAMMASLRRGSEAILSPFRTKYDDPEGIGSRSPEAVESRRKNRRYGE